jgi:hypothetical protein
MTAIDDAVALAAGLQQTRNAFGLIITSRGGTIPAGSSLSDYPPLVEGVIEAVSASGEIIAERTLRITIVGGNGPFVINWGDTTSTALGFDPGDDPAPIRVAQHTYANFAEYQATVTDLSASSLVNASFVPVFAVVSLVISDIATREVTLTLINGSPDYTIDWGDGSTDTVQDELVATHEYAAAGDYTVTITDDDLTEITAFIAVTAAPVVTATNSAPLTRTVTATIAGGTGPFEFDWGDSTTTETSERVVSHSYATSGSKTITVTDAFARTDDVAITVPTPVSVTAAATDTTNHIATLTITPGQSPYTIDWGDSSVSTGVTATGPTHDYAAAGDYAITVTDANGWVATTAVNFAITGGALSITAIESGDYKAKVTINGGTGPFQIQWDQGGNNLPAQTGVTDRVVEYTYAGQYSGSRVIRVTDSLGAISNYTLDISSQVTEKTAWQCTMLIGQQHAPAATQLIGFQRTPTVRFGDISPVAVADGDTTRLVFAYNGGTNHVRMTFDGGQLAGVTTVDVEVEDILDLTELTWDSVNNRYWAAVAGSYDLARAKLGQQVGVSGLPTATVNQVPRWRSMYHSSALSAARPANLPQYLDYRFEGESPQFFISGCIAPTIKAGETHPRIIFCQDIAGPFGSSDGLVTLVPLEGANLRAVYCTGIQFDPDNPDRIIGVFGEQNIPHCVPGVYLRDPTTKSWSLKRRAQRGGADMESSRNQAHNNLLTIWPKGTGTAWDERQVNYLEVESNLGTMTADAHFYRSFDGGETFTQQAALPTAMLRANWYNLIQTGVNTFYAYGTAGEWRTTNGGTSWTQTRTGRVITGWHDPDDANHRIISVSAGSTATGGLWRTTNNGGAWTQILAAANTGSFAVSPKDGDFRHIWVGFEGGNVPAPWVQRWDTTDDPVTTIRAAGTFSATGWNRGNHDFLSDALNSHDDGTTMGRAQTQLLADPVDPHRCYMSGDANFFWTNRSSGTATDSGRDWIRGGAGYHGVNPQSVAVCPTNSDIQAIGVGDVQFMRTANRWKTSERIKLSPADETALVAAFGAGGSRNPRVADLCILPHDSTVPVGYRGRCVIAIGNETDAQTCGYWDPGDANLTMFLSRTLAAGGGLGIRRFVAMDAADPSIIYNGRNRSTDYGDTYTRLFAGGRTLVGVSAQTGGRIFCLSSNFLTLDRSDSGGADSSWVTWIDGSTDFPTGISWRAQYTNQYRQFGVKLSPHDDTKTLIWVNRTGGGQDLALVSGYTTPTILPLNLFGQSPLNGAAVNKEAPFACWCPSNPRVIYAQVSSIGDPRIWRGTFAADYASITWENWSFNLSRTCNAYRMWPGAENEVYALSGVGTKVMFGTDGPRAGGLWLRAPSLVAPPF